MAREEASAIKKCPPCWKAILRHRKMIMAIVAPLALMPLIFYVRTAQAKCAYVLILLACYWNFEVMPLGITALLPVVLIPLLGVVPSRDLCPSYFKDSNMLFLGGLMLAVSVELWDLHKRIALKVLLMCGVQPRWLLFGFMLPTFSLSMWISNTATVSMMLPTAEAVLLELRRHYEANRRKMEAAEAMMPPELAASNSTAVLVEGVSVAVSSGSSDKQQIELQQQQLEDAANAQQEPAVKAVEESDSASQPSPENGEQQTYQEHRLQLGVMEARIDAEMEALTHAQLRATMKKFMADEKNTDFTKIARMLMLSLSYAAIMGGISTLTGTAPNVVMYGIVQDYFGSETPLNYSSWMFFAVPIAIVTLVIAWVWLQISFLGCRGIATSKHLPKKDEEAIMKVLRREYNKLGPISYAEVNIMILFSTAIGLLIAREPGAPGWGRAFIWPDPKTPSKPLSFMGDAQPLVICAILMFLLPSKNPFRRLRCRGRQRASADLAATAPEPSTTAEKKPKKPKTLLDWKAMQERVAWQIILMLGAGLAIADTSKSSGLSDWASNQLLSFGVIPIAGLIFITCFFTSLTTQVTFNSGTATLLLPIFASFAQRIHVNPLYLMVACTVSCSYGLILPVSTPANVLVFHSGYLRTTDMTRTGVVMWLVCNTIAAIAMITYAPEIFRLREFPAWAALKNSTVG